MKERERDHRTARAESHHAVWTSGVDADEWGRSAGRAGGAVSALPLPHRGVAEHVARVRARPEAVLRVRGGAGADWRTLTPADLGSFTAWLRRPAANVLQLPGAPPARSQATVSRVQSAVFAFYALGAHPIVASAPRRDGQIASAGPVVRVAPHRSPATDGVAEIAVPWMPSGGVVKGDLNFRRGTAARLLPGDCESGGHERKSRHGRSARPCSAYARAGPGEAWPADAPRPRRERGRLELWLLVSVSGAVVLAARGGCPHDRATEAGRSVPTALLLRVAGSNPPGCWR